jgi:hypothetical protein
MMLMSVAVLALAIGACERKGPVERVGQSIDHATDTLRNGGKEPLGDRMEDAADRVRDGKSLER